MHRVMKKDCTLIPEEHEERGGAYGAGSKTGRWLPGRSGTGRNTHLSVARFVRRSSVSRKYGDLLYRIARWQAPQEILELGTGLGISTMYLGAGTPDAPLHSIEGSKVRALLAQQVIQRAGLKNVEVKQGEVENQLEEILPGLQSRYLAFMDANHHFEPTLRYLSSILEKEGEEAVIVMDDIYWSRGMYRAWKEAISWPEVRVSIDLYHLGILLLRKDLNKTHLKIKF